MTKAQYIRFEDDVVKLVDDWRKQQDKIPSFNTAVNTMLRGKPLNQQIDEVQSAFSHYLSAASNVGVPPEKLEPVFKLVKVLESLRPGRGENLNE